MKCAYSRWLWRLYAIAFVPRLVLSLMFFTWPITLSDMYQYDMLGRSLLSGHGYRWYSAADVEQIRPYLSLIIDLTGKVFPSDGFVTTFRAPGYPFFLAALYAVLPVAGRFGFVRLVQAGVMAATAPLVALLAIKIGVPRKWAMGAGLVAAFYPMFLFYPLGLASENLFIPLVLVAFLLLLKAADSERRRDVALAGTVLGLAILTRSILATFAVLAGLWFWRMGKMGGKGAVLLLVVTLGVCAPWAARNTAASGRLTFVENSLGYNLFMGYYPEGNGGFVDKIAAIPLAILDDNERDRWTTRMALQYIREDPGEALRRVVRRGAFFAGVEDRELGYFYGAGFFGRIAQPWLAALYLILILPWLGVSLLGAWGICLALQHEAQRAAAWLAVALMIGYGAPHLFIIAEARFHLALVPILLPFAAYAWPAIRAGGVAEIARSYNRSTLVLMAAAAIILLALWSWGFAMNWSKLIALMGPEGSRLYLPY